MQKYHISSRVIHWVMAIIILSLLAVGIYMEDFLPKDASYRMQVYNLHKSFGVIALILIFVRIFNRFLHKAPALPESIPAHEKFLAHLVHFLLYVLMLIMPFSGYLMSNSYGYPVHLFGLKMPNLVEKNYELGAIFAKTHHYAGYILIALLFLHILGALKHKFFDKPENDILKRMI